MKIKLGFRFVIFVTTYNGVCILIINLVMISKIRKAKQKSFHSLLSPFFFHEFPKSFALQNYKTIYLLTWSTITLFNYNKPIKSMNGQC